LLWRPSFLKTDKADEAAVKEIVQSLKGAFTSRSAQFDKGGDTTRSDVESIRQQLAAPGWVASSGVRKQTREAYVDVLLMITTTTP